MGLSFQIAVGSFAVSLVVLGIKYYAYVLTGSIALYSDAVESVVNVVTAGGAILATWSASRPADARHPYGHHKAEYLAAVAVGVMIILAALAIFRQAHAAFLSPKPLDAPWLGLAVSMVAAVINAVWSQYMLRQGTAHRSAVLIADAKHLRVDVVTSIGVLVGLVLVVITGIHSLDPAIAVLVAVNVLWSGWRVVIDSASGLLDEAIPQDEIDRIRRIISSHADGAIEAHDVRTRHAGKATFIEFHLVVAGDMTVAQSHNICDRIETALKSAIDGASVHIHVEPEHKAKQVMRSAGDAEGIEVIEQLPGATAAPRHPLERSKSHS